MARSKSTAHSLEQGEIRSTDGLPVVTPHAAGADIGAQQIYVCIPGPDQTQIARSFGTYTADLHTLADWLVENGASRPLPWNPPASTGSPSSRCWSNGGSTAASSAATSPAASPPATRPMSWTVSGSKPCTAWAC